MNSSFKIKFHTFIQFLLAILFISLFYYQSMMMVQLSKMDEVKVDYISLIALSLVLFISLLTINKFILNQHCDNFLKLIIFLFSAKAIVDMFTDPGNLNSKIVATLQGLLIPGFVSYFFYVSKNYDLKNYFSKCSFGLLVGLTGTYLYILLFRNDLAFWGIFASLNASYFLLILLPCIILGDISKFLRVTAIILVAIVVFSSMKRGGIIAFILSILVYYIVDAFTLGSSLKNKILVVTSFILSFTLLLVFIQIDSYASEYILGRFESMSEDEGSGRLGIYLEVIDKIKHSDPITFIFGHGRLAVQQVTAYRLPAHNDFLEMFYDYGLLMFILYSFMHICIIKDIFKLVKLGSKFGSIMAMSYVIFFIFSMISHVFIYSYFLFFLMLWATIRGTINRENKYEGRK